MKNLIVILFGLLSAAARGETACVVGEGALNVWGVVKVENVKATTDIDFLGFGGVRAWDGWNPPHDVPGTLLTDYNNRAQALESARWLQQNGRCDFVTLEKAEVEEDWSRVYAAEEISYMFNKALKDCDIHVSTSWGRKAFYQSMDGRLTQSERGKMLELGNKLFRSAKYAKCGHSDSSLYSEEQIANAFRAALNLCEMQISTKWIETAFNQAMDGRLTQSERGKMLSLGSSLLKSANARKPNCGS